MNRNSVLLSISAALLFSLYIVDGGHAFQIDRNQNAGTASLPTKQVSTAPNPCTEGGKGSTGAPGKQRCPQGSGAMATAGSRYISHVSTTPNPCGGRIGVSCKNQSQQGSGAMATDGSEYTLTTSASAAGTLFGVGLITLVVIGARRLRHPHGHHA